MNTHIRTKGLFAMLTRLAMPIMLLPGAAFAHEAPVAHAHPHGDWGLFAFALLAVGAAGVFAAVRAIVRARYPKGNHHDSR